MGECFRDQEGNWIKGKNRTVEMIYNDHERWKRETNSNEKLLKEFNSAKHEPVIAKSKQLILLQAPITPLHDMKLGPVNHILDDCSKLCENNELENFLEKKGITREVYFHKLEGNEVTRIMQALDELENELPMDKLQHVNSLKALKELQDAVCKTELDEQYKVKIDDFKKEYNKLREEAV